MDCWLTNSNYCVLGTGLGTGIQHEHGDVPVLRAGEEETGKNATAIGHTPQTGIKKMIAGQQGSLEGRESENNIVQVYPALSGGAGGDLGHWSLDDWFLRSHQGWRNAPRSLTPV